MKVGPFPLSGNSFPVIAGPCVIESPEHVLRMAEALAQARDRLGLALVFKTSFDKANRSSAESYRGIALEEALPIFQRIRADLKLPVVTDFHTVEQAEQLQGSVDALQVPAFLCRQTDMLQAAARTGLPVLVKKGQFLSPWEVGNIADKLRAGGGTDFAIVERGTSFGYHNLVSDMRAIAIIKEQGIPVIFDATHSAQLPGEGGKETGGRREYIPTVARAAVAAGCDGIFIEVHDRPEQARSDSATQWPLDRFEKLMVSLLAFRKTYLETAGSE